MTPRRVLLVAVVLAFGCGRCGGCELSLPMLERPVEPVVTPPPEVLVQAPVVSVDAAAAPCAEPGDRDVVFRVVEE